MAIATLPTIESRDEIVFTEDPDVTPKNGCRGWIVIHEADVTEGADRVEVRPLNISERTKSLDIEGLHAGMLNRVRRGVTRVNGSSKRDVITNWISRVPSDAVFLLGCYIASVTAGDDPQSSQAAFFRETSEGPEGD